MTFDAIRLLYIYGCRWKDLSPAATDEPAVFQKVAADLDPIFKERVVYQLGIQDLTRLRLFWTDYKVNVEGSGRDSFGAHATKLGWLVIEHLWNHDPKMRKPSNAPTGPR